MKIEHVIERPDAGRRLDRFVQAALGSVPSSLIQRLLRQGQVRLNGGKGKAGDRLAVGDTVIIHHRPREGDAPPQTAAEPVAASYAGPPVEVLLENDSWIVVNKLAGLSCHEPDGTHPSLLTWARHRYAAAMTRGEVRPALAHRLDLGTSGAVAVALTAAAVHAFHHALEQGQVGKHYQVAVWGQPTEVRFELTAPLRRLPHSYRNEPKVMMATTEDGAQAAHTRFEVVRRGAQASLLEAIPVTGRTHQIRAHLFGARLPVVGDPRYGDPRRDRQHGLATVLQRPLLHARALAFPWEGEVLQVAAPLPADARAALKILGLLLH